MKVKRRKKQKLGGREEENSGEKQCKDRDNRKRKLTEMRWLIYLIY